MQRELTAVRAELLQKDIELDNIRQQNREITDELAWVVKDLLRLKNKDNDDKCQSWLLSSQGLSTVLAKQSSVPLQQTSKIPLAACLCAHSSGTRPPGVA